MEEALAVKWNFFGRGGKKRKKDEAYIISDFYYLFSDLSEMHRDAESIVLNPGTLYFLGFFFQFFDYLLPLIKFVMLVQQVIIQAVVQVQGKWEIRRLAI